MLFKLKYIFFNNNILINLLLLKKKCCINNNNNNNNKSIIVFYISIISSYTVMYRNCLSITPLNSFFIFKIIENTLGVLL